MTDKETYAIIDSRGLCIAFLPYNPLDKVEELEKENAGLRKDIKACNTCEHSAKIYGNENTELKAEKVYVYTELIEDKIYQ